MRRVLSLRCAVSLYGSLMLVVVGALGSWLCPIFFCSFINFRSVGGGYVYGNAEGGYLVFDSSFFLPLCAMC